MFKINLIILIIILCITIPGFTQEKTKKIEAGEIGYILLNDLILTFESYDPYKPMQEWKDKVFNSLSVMFESARNAKAQGNLDKKFFSRYKRILYVLELSLMMKDSEENSVLLNLINEQIKKFDIPEDLLNKLEINLMGSIAGAVAEEILSLKKYLDWKTALFVPEFARPKIIKKVKIKLPSPKVLSELNKSNDGTIDLSEDPDEGQLLNLKKPANFKKGKVLLEVVIDKKGNVIYIRLISSKYPQLNNSILEAVMQFKFNPYFKKKVARSVKFKLTLYCYL